MSDPELLSNVFLSLNMGLFKVANVSNPFPKILGAININISSTNFWLINSENVYAPPSTNILDIPISFNFDKAYLEKKTAEIFGKKILFQFEDQPQNSSRSNEKRSNSDSKGVKREDDPLIDLIISELGGEEISG